MYSTQDKIQFLKKRTDKTETNLIEVPKGLLEQFLNQDVLRAWVSEKYYNQVVLIEYLQNGEFRVNDAPYDSTGKPKSYHVCWWKGGGNKADKILEIMKNGKTV